MTEKSGGGCRSRRDRDADADAAADDDADGFDDDAAAAARSLPVEVNLRFETAAGGRVLSSLKAKGRADGVSCTGKRCATARCSTPDTLLLIS